MILSGSKVEEERLIDPEAQTVEVLFCSNAVNPNVWAAGNGGDMPRNACSRVSDSPSGSCQGVRSVSKVRTDLFTGRLNEKIGGFKSVKRVLDAEAQFDPAFICGHFLPNAANVKMGHRINLDIKVMLVGIR